MIKCLAFGLELNYVVGFGALRQSARNAAGVCQHIYPFTPLELTFDGGTDSLFETFAFNIDNCVSPYIGVGVWCVDN